MNRETIKLSVVIITFNEEQNIERCLQSVQGIADEIVVLDSFSTDKTQEICETYNVKFFQHKFDGYIQQKNRALTYASSPYVLSLDADEALSDTLKKSIIDIKSNWTADGYSFNRLTFYCGHPIRHTDWYPDKKLRIWDIRKGSWTGENPHDRFELTSGTTVKHIKGDLLHYSYLSIGQHLAQVNRFTDINSMEAFKKGKNAGLTTIFFSPIIKFVKSYFVRFGFLDGYYGFVVCSVSAFASFMKYVKLRELNKSKKNEQS